MSLLSLLPLLPKGVSIIEAEHFFFQAVEDTFVVNLAAGESVIRSRTRSIVSLTHINFSFTQPLLLPGWCTTSH